MSKTIQVWTLSSEQQDDLWKDYCPICNSKIINAERNVDFAKWHCERCDTLFLCE